MTDCIDYIDAPAVRDHLRTLPPLPPAHNGVVFSAICRIDGKSTVLSSPVFDNPAAPEVGDAERFFAGRLFYATETVEDFRALVLDVCKDKGVETGSVDDARSVCIARDLWDFACGSPATPCEDAG